MDWLFSKRSTCKCLSLLLLGCSKCSEHEIPHFFLVDCCECFKWNLESINFFSVVHSILFQSGGKNETILDRDYEHHNDFAPVLCEACIERCSLQASPELWKVLGRLKKIGGAVGCGAPGR